MRNVNNSMRASTNQFFPRPSPPALPERTPFPRPRRDETRGIRTSYVETDQNITPTANLANVVTIRRGAPPPLTPFQHRISPFNRARCNVVVNDDVGEKRNATRRHGVATIASSVGVHRWTPVRWCRNGGETAVWARWSVGANIHYRFGGV